MKVSLNWLREFVELPSTTADLVDLLTLAGVEVEGVQTRGVAVSNVIVAQIRESVQHPNADRLSVCQVDDGSGAARQIVCGAKNYKAGDKVPLALPGAVLPGDFKIKVGKLRGVESQGMLCSAKELNLAEDAEGLLILSPDAKVGAPIGELFPSDTILDLEITPNRSDLLSHLGIAREIAALTGAELKVRRTRAAELNYTHLVEIEDEECPLYTARHIANVTVGPSPEWLRQRLEAVGVRSINNIVDITNYVMLELGQPLHAFDAARLDGDLRVRFAQEGEEMLALDGRTYRLSPEQMVIADGSRAVAIAGIMGGEETAVRNETRAIWLESAYFLASSIRCTSRRLGLSSDSSYRFEREVDPAGVLVASQRAAQLVAELAGGEAGELRLGFAADSQFGFDAEGAAEGVEYCGRVPLRAERCADLLGVELDEETIDAVLTRLGLRKTEGWWEIPSYRSDLTREVDLIEEVARVVGMDAIEGCTYAPFAPASANDRVYDSAMTVRRACVAHGLHEARSITLVPAEPLGLAFTHTSASDLRRVKNPMIDDQVVLRPGLLHGLLEAVATNARAGAKSVRLFEIGRVFSERSPEESTHLAMVLSGPTAEPSWRSSSTSDADLFHLKGVIAGVLGSGVSFEPDSNDALALSLLVSLEGERIGFAGQLWPADARGLDASAPVLFAEVYLDAAHNGRSREGAKKFRQIPRFPSTMRDIAMLVPIDLPHGRIASILQTASEPLLERFELFDVFADPTGEKLPAGTKSLAYSLTYRSSDRTLTADEVNAAHARLKDRLKSESGAQFRE